MKRLTIDGAQELSLVTLLFWKKTANQNKNIFSQKSGQQFPKEKRLEGWSHLISDQVNSIKWNMPHLEEY